MRAVQNCMLARGSAPEIFIGFATTGGTEIGDRDGNRVRCPSPAAAAAVQYTFPPADILSAEEALLRSLGITASSCASTMNEIKCSPTFTIRILSQALIPSPCWGRGAADEQT